MLAPRITLEAKNEGLHYEDSSGIYHFNLSRQGKTWVVHLPPSKGEAHALYSLTPQDQERIFPSIRSFLSRIWWFGIWPVRYEVKFDDQTA